LAIFSNRAIEKSVVPNQPMLCIEASVHWCLDYLVSIFAPEGFEQNVHQHRIN